MSVFKRQSFFNHFYFFLIIYDYWLYWWSCHFIDIDLVCISLSWALIEKKSQTTITIYINIYIYHPGKKKKRRQTAFRIHFLRSYPTTATSYKDTEFFQVWYFISILFPRKSPMILPLSEPSLSCTRVGWIFCQRFLGHGSMTFLAALTPQALPGKLKKNKNKMQRRQLHFTHWYLLNLFW